MLSYFLFKHTAVIAVCFDLSLSIDTKHIDSNLQIYHAAVGRCRGILLAVLVSSHFKIFLIATMVWEFPFSVIFIIDLFVLSSNTVALKVISESAMNRCIAACFCAHAVKLLVTQISTQRSLRF
ncbi:hypothetical protein POTOM_008567 [Populus tomentosa]|uniref:Protein ARV n=1 Tax=Populus tomentosa TaxID=118781 RepID=A0A8X8AED4_POPTO|nr:hypothetical protein POTOM_008567 [Populus tomentosa]